LNEPGITVKAKISRFPGNGAGLGKQTKQMKTGQLAFQLNGLLGLPGFPGLIYYHFSILPY
jgi:hypothetical protein